MPSGSHWRHDSSAGIEALDLDIDTVLAGCAAHNPQHRANPLKHAVPMDAIVGFGIRYAKRLPLEQTPSLHGFITWVDHLASVEDEAASLPDAPVDVELMTATSQRVGMGCRCGSGAYRRRIPQQSGRPSQDRAGRAPYEGTEQGHWTAPEYREDRRLLAHQPTAVPLCLCVPMPAFCRDSP